MFEITHVSSVKQGIVGAYSMLNRKTDEKEGSILEASSGPLEPIDNEALNNFLGEPEEFAESIQVKPAFGAPAAVIGPKIRFKGELTGDEDLLIQGHVEGSIDLKGHKLVVGEKGLVKANITAKNLVVEGKIEGDILASELITITQTSHVQGNVKAARVVLEDGAKLQGSIDMDTKGSTTNEGSNVKHDKANTLITPQGKKPH